MIVWSINSLNFVLGLTTHKYLPLPAPTPVIAGATDPLPWTCQGHPHGSFYARRAATSR